MDIENEEFQFFLKCANKNQLRYLCIGGYAVNYYGYHRNTEDLDIWIAPTNENKSCFLETLKCMGYTDEELHEIKDEDFTSYFVCTLGERPYVIDVLTIIHKNLNFDEAEKNAVKHTTGEDIEIFFIPYEFLKDAKLLSQRQKDFFDIARLEELKNKKNQT
ncbi:MAG: hypothetical protein ABJA79_07145 [Parafilimonas sp.]